ncbi:MAG: SpoVG family protein [Candidatus Omnitrophica bacterium]|nr:SpoVG family protein [Candidatus Omnitrophota bacterium]
MIDALEVKVHKMYTLPGNKPLKAFADIAINDAVLIKGIKVIEGRDGLFMSMPQDQGKDNKWYESVRCLSDEVRQQISETVLMAYKSTTGH